MIGKREIDFKLEQLPTSKPTKKVKIDKTAIDQLFENKNQKDEEIKEQYVSFSQLEWKT